jgi:hypothetical protein
VNPVDPAPEAPPPILGRWRNLYAVVLAGLLLWILLLLLFEKAFT